LDIKFGCHLSKLFKYHKNCDIQNDMLKLMDIEKKSNIRPTLKFTLHIKNLLSESLFSSNFQSPKINNLLKKKLQLILATYFYCSDIYYSL